jgi:hypothetical protein
MEHALGIRELRIGVERRSTEVRIPEWWGESS